MQTLWLTILKRTFCVTIGPVIRVESITVVSSPDDERSIASIQQRCIDGARRVKHCHAHPRSRRHFSTQDMMHIARNHDLCNHTPSRFEVARMFRRVRLR